MSEKTEADLIVNEAWRAFDAWLKSRPDETQELSLLDQIELYGIWFANLDPRARLVEKDDACPSCKRPSNEVEFGGFCHMGGCPLGGDL